MKICLECGFIYRTALRDTSERPWPPVYRCPRCKCLENYKRPEDEANSISIEPKESLLLQNPVENAASNVPHAQVEIASNSNELTPDENSVDAE